MLTKQEINDLCLYLNEDVEKLNLSNIEIADRIIFYLENIAGIEFMTDNKYEEMLNLFLNQSKIVQTQI